MANPVSAGQSIDSSSRPVAPFWHTAILVGVLALIAIGGALFQRSGGASSASPHASLIPLYLSLLAAEWGLLAFVRKGSLRSGTTLKDLIGPHWQSPRGLLLDALLGTALWGVWEAVDAAWAHTLGTGHAASIGGMLPRSALEITLWVALSLSAGFCEEVAFRGYCQRQFAALTRNRGLGLVLQALLFGVAHGYQGLQACLKIVLYGALFGLLALWRKSLRPGMFGHALTDIVGGLFGI
jgi:uncharacterized protein